MPAHDMLETLREQVRGIERGRQAERGGGEMPIVATPWAAMPRGRLHEWLGVGGDPAGQGQDQGQGLRIDPWAPPLCVMADLGRRAVEQAGGWVFWIGRRIWPYPAVLAPPGKEKNRSSESGPSLLDRTITVAATRPAEILWAADLVARSPATAAVVLDASSLDMAATRRLQLAAEAGSALVLACRPPRHLGQLSAASYRWRIDRCPDPADAPRWTVSLVRCKDASPVAPARIADCVLEWNHATRSVSCPASVADRSREAIRRTA